RREKESDHGARFLPGARLANELLPSRFGNRIEPRAPIVLRDAPLTRDEPLLLQLEERRVEGAIVERELVAARLLDAAADAVAVGGAEEVERLEDHEGEGALLDVELRHGWRVGPLLLESNRSAEAWVADHAGVERFGGFGCQGKSDVGSPDIGRRTRRDGERRRGRTRESGEGSNESMMEGAAPPMTVATTREHQHGRFQTPCRMAAG